MKRAIASVQLQFFMITDQSSYSSYYGLLNEQLKSVQLYPDKVILSVMPVVGVLTSSKVLCVWMNFEYRLNGRYQNGIQIP